MFKVEEFKELLQKDGFELVKVKELTEEPYDNTIIFTVRKEGIDAFTIIPKDTDRPLSHYIGDLLIDIGLQKDALRITKCRDRLETIKETMKESFDFTFDDVETLETAIGLINDYIDLREEGCD